ncbi:MAG: anthranilate phosphoribosyltransferase, partial [Pseudomonadota bacterium]
TGSISGITLCSINGADEALPFEQTNIAHFQNNNLSIYSIEPFLNGSVKDLLGGEALDNAKITMQILDGTIKGIALETVILNAAIGLIAAGKVDSLEEAKEIAKEAVKSKKTLKKLEQIIRISNKL